LAYLLPLVKLLSDPERKKKKSKVLIIAPTFELSVQIYKVCLRLIGKKKPFEGIRIGHLTKLLLEKKKKKEEIDPETLLGDLGKNQYVFIYSKILWFLLHKSF
jgi:superfamily II DNA/RNA helicase